MRFPSVWSSFSSTKSDVLDMPIYTSASPLSRTLSAATRTRKWCLGNLLLSIGEQAKLETIKKTSASDKPYMRTSTNVTRAGDCYVYG